MTATPHNSCTVRLGYLCETDQTPALVLFDRIHKNVVTIALSEVHQVADRMIDLAEHQADRA